MYAAIGFDLMYENGIAQVEEGLFSQTLSFDDISYQSAREENQQAIFSGWCQLFDYFGAESCVQLSIVNRPIPADLIGRKRFFSEEDLDTAAYAAEYNRILNEKMREGVSNLTRERYLSESIVWMPRPRSASVSSLRWLFSALRICAILASSHPSIT